MVRSIEETPVKRQRTREVEWRRTEWFWATSLPQAQLSTRGILEAGHGRWAIENYGFNEVCTRACQIRFDSS